MSFQQLKTNPYYTILTLLLALMLSYSTKICSPSQQASVLKDSLERYEYNITSATVFFASVISPSSDMFFFGTINSGNSLLVLKVTYPDLNHVWSMSYIGFEGDTYGNVVTSTHAFSLQDTNSRDNYIQILEITTSTGDINMISRYPDFYANPPLLVLNDAETKMFFPIILEYTDAKI